MAGEGGGAWLRPLTRMEKECEEAHQGGCLVVGHVYRWSTDRPLTHHDGVKLFTSLIRKAPNLRLCLGDKDGELWMREMQEERVDFQMVVNGNIHEEFLSMSTHHFNTFSGPLWAARLLNCSPSHPSTYFSESSKTFPELPRAGVVEPPSKHPHQCHLLIGYHHAISDGYSGLQVGRALLSMCNDIIAGNTIDESKQIGNLVDVSQEEKLCKEIETLYINDPKLFEARRILIQNFDLNEDFLNVYPVLTEVQPKTLFMWHVLDEEENKTFLMRCKAEGVTYHIGFCTALHAAIAEMFLSAGVEKDVYKVPAIHNVNQRKYLQDCTVLGLCRGFMFLTKDIYKDIRQHFWNEARKFSGEFKDRLKHRAGLEDQVITNMTKTKFNNCYFSTSNMGDATSIFSNCGKHVEMEWMNRLTSIQLFNVLWENSFQSYKGRLLHSFNYNTHKMTTQTARKLSQTLFNIMAGACRV